MSKRKGTGSRKKPCCIWCGSSVKDMDRRAVKEHTRVCKRKVAWRCQELGWRTYKVIL